MDFGDWASVGDVGGFQALERTCCVPVWILDMSHWRLAGCNSEDCK